MWAPKAKRQITQVKKRWREEDNREQPASVDCHSCHCESILFCFECERYFCGSDFDLSHVAEPNHKFRLLAGVAENVTTTFTAGVWEGHETQPRNRELQQVTTKARKRKKERKRRKRRKRKKEKEKRKEKKEERRLRRDGGVGKHSVCSSFPFIGWFVADVFPIHHRASGGFGSALSCVQTMGTMQRVSYGVTRGERHIDQKFTLHINKLN